MDRIEISTHIAAVNWEDHPDDPLRDKFRDAIVGILQHLDNEIAGRSQFELIVNGVVARCQHSGCGASSELGEGDLMMCHACSACLYCGVWPGAYHGRKLYSDRACPKDMETTGERIRREWDHAGLRDRNVAIYRQYGFRRATAYGPLRGRVSMETVARRHAITRERIRQIVSSRLRIQRRYQKEALEARGKTFDWRGAYKHKRYMSRNK